MVRGMAPAPKARPIRAVIIGEERDGRSRACQIGRRIVGRCGEDAIEDDAVLIEQVGGLKNLRQFLLGLRVGRRAEEAEHDPAAGRDGEIEGAAADQGRGKGRNGIA